MSSELNGRLFQFSVRCLKYCKRQPETTEYKVIKHQLIKSVTSAGANYEEAQAGSSRADFNNKIRIALREMRETNYWLRLIGELLSNESKDEELKQLVLESDELKSILGSIVQKTRQNK